jgi:hypothetical protein
VTRALAAALMLFVMERPVFRPAGSESAQVPQTTGFPTTAGRITGRVLLNGHPAAAARVQTSAVYMVNGERRLVAPGGSATTDNNDGTYEIVTRPGLYVVFAQPETWDLARRVNRPVASQPTLHPSATDVAQAHLVRVEAGRTAEGIDIDCVLNAPASVSGRVVTSDGKPAAFPAVGVTSLTPFSVIRSNTIPPDGRGSFAISSLPPGRYQLTASANRDNTGDWTRTEIVVDGDVTDLVLTLSKPLTLTGRVVFRAHGGAAIPDVSTLTASVFGAASTVTGVGLIGDAPLSADGTFAVSGLRPGRYAVQVRSSPPLPPTWTVESPEIADVREAQRCCWLFGVLANVPLRGTPDPVTVVLTDRATALSGTVTDADGQPSAANAIAAVPVERAEWLAGSSRMPLPVRPGSDGRYEFARLPPGEYFVSSIPDVDQTAWSFGAWPDIDTTKATRVSIASGERKTLDLRMRGPVKPAPQEAAGLKTGRSIGTISGRLQLDRPRQGFGDVRAFRVWTTPQGERMLGGPPGGYQAELDNNSGDYIIRALPEGDYVVVGVATDAAGLQPAPAVKNPSAPLARQAGSTFAGRSHPTFHPAALDLRDAEIVRLAGNADVRGIDVSLVKQPWSRVEGRVVDPSGQTAPYAQVEIGLVSLPPELRPMLGLQRMTPLADGSFSFVVPLGRYVIAARASGVAITGSTGNSRRLWGQTEVTVSGFDVDNLVLRMEDGATISGTVSFTGASPPLDDVFVAAVPERDLPGAIVPGLPSGVNRDGTFTIVGVAPGRYTLMARSTTGKSWTMDRAVFDGRNLDDQPMEVRAGQAISGVAISMSDRPSELACTVTDGSGAPITTYTLAIVPADPAHRRLGSARLPKPGRPAATDGRYVVSGLPPGDYLIFALSDHDEVAWAAGIRPDLDPASAVKVSIASGEKKTVAVRVRPKAHGPRPK